MAGEQSARKSAPDTPVFRAAPHNVEAEQALLGAILVNNEAFYRVSDFLEPPHFFEPIHAKIFELAASLIRAGKVASPVTLKTFLPLDLDGDKSDLDVRLQAMNAPTDLKTVTVLGMKLTDTTPELRTAYSLFDAGGALILDPGPNSVRLGIGRLEHGYNFWMVGNKRVANVREFVEQILAEAAAQNRDQYSIRVVYSLSTLAFDGTNTQYLKLTKDDIEQVQGVAEQLKAANK